MHEGRIVRWDVDIEYADPFVVEHFVMPGFLADLDLGIAGSGQADDGEKEDGAPELVAVAPVGLMRTPMADSSGGVKHSGVGLGKPPPMPAPKHS